MGPRNLILIAFGSFLLICLSFGAVYLQYNQDEIETSPFVSKSHVLPQVKAELDPNDIIYQTRKDKKSYIPVVNEEYKTVFFFIGKCASTEWKRMFVRMMGSAEWDTHAIHQKEVNGLKWLNDYSLEEAQQIMTNPEWTKAVFVRHPKDRILSSFLDKAVRHSEQFIETTCKKYGNLGKHGDEQTCIAHHLEFKFFLQNIISTIPTNGNWMQIYDQIDAKWWPYVNYVGHMDDLTKDAQHFLQSIISVKDGVSAWERWGTTGWDLINGTSSFLNHLAKYDKLEYQRVTEKKLHKYYNPWLERYVERKYSKDLNNTYFQFSPVEVFPHTDFAEFEGDKI